MVFIENAMRRSAFAALCAIPLVALAGSCLAAPPVAAAASQSASKATSKLAPSPIIEAGDILDIHVYGEDALARTITVGGDGLITYPFVGTIDVIGMPVNLLKQKLRKHLLVEFSDPDISIALTSVKSASIIGAVRLPGPYVIKPGWNILDMISQAGGLVGATPDQVTASLIRKGSVNPIPVDLVAVFSNSNLAANLPVASGDTLIIAIRPAPPVEVLGQVTRPGEVPLPLDGSVAGAIAAAGGLTPGASLADATISRGTLTIPVDLHGYVDGQTPSGGVTLHAGDTLYIPQNKLKYSILGAVVTPGTVTYPEGHALDVLTALTTAGGPTPTADIKNGALLRKSAENKAVVTKVDFSKFVKGDLAGNVPVQPGDVIWIPTKGTKYSFGLRDAVLAIPIISLLR